LVQSMDAVSLDEKWHTSRESLQHDGPDELCSWSTQSCGATPRAAGWEPLDWEDTLEGGKRRTSTQECIRVAARFRPLSQLERENGGEAKVCVRFGQDAQSCALRIPRKHTVCEFPFAYDHLFQPEASQDDVYKAVAQPIVEGIMKGFNGAILAYGQTGSGKTHTMFGPTLAARAFEDHVEPDPQSLGIIPRALQELVNYATNTDGLVQLRVSYVETYNENVIDLLSPLSPAAECEAPSAVIREQAKDLFLPTVTETPVASVREAMEVMRLGNRNRHQAETKMNLHSSRSHAVFIVTVINTVDQSRQRFGQLYLVDLAGSERVTKTGVDGTQLVEAKNINKSLLALGQVIFALAHKQKHIPYRDSKLTQLLRNCLGGNARTAILITASPHVDNAGESLSALRFGARASLVQNVARENIAESVQELKRLLERARQDLAELRASNRRLQAELSACRAAPGGCSLPMEGEGLPASSAQRLVIWGLLPSLVCPISRAIMRDPVVASDGWSYERRALAKHIAKAGRAMPLSPVTGQRLATRAFGPNFLVKQLVSQYLPDLAPLDQPVPLIHLLHIWHVQLILSFLDFRSVARCEISSSSLLAIAGDKAWSQLLLRDLPHVEAEPCNAKAAYRDEAALTCVPGKHTGKGKGKGDGAWRGLRLFQPGGTL